MSADDQDERSADTESSERWPIGFMLLVGAAALYLGWRLVQGIAWVVEQLGG